jgi:hypothetical protein
MEFFKSNKTIIIFNGPPSSGKDVCAKHFTTKFNNGELGPDIAERMEHKHHLKRIALLLTGIPEDVWDARYNDRALKEEPWNRCGGISQRNLYIKISEDWCKPLFGKSYFGDRSTQRIKKIDKLYFFFSDGGFDEETIPMLEECERMIIIRIHRDGTNFLNDSRKYLHMNMPDRIKEYDLYNNGTEEEMFQTAWEFIVSE